MQYYAKALYAGVVAFLGSLLAALQVVEGIGINDIGTAAWVTIALAAILAVGGVLGLQAAPASISTSVKPNP
jgi:hypothetical protein